MQEALSILAGALFTAAFVPYLRDIWKKEGWAEPSITSFGIWSVLDSITLATMWAHGTFSWQVFGGLLGAIAVFLSALFRGTFSWGWVDTACTALAALGAFAWATSGNPLLGLACSLFATFIAVGPSAAGAWKDPSKESKTAWTMFFVACLIQICAIRDWTTAGIAQPLTFLAVNTTMAGIVWFRKPPPQGG